MMSNTEGDSQDHYPLNAGNFTWLKSYKTVFLSFGDGDFMQKDILGNLRPLFYYPYSWEVS